MRERKFTDEQIRELLKNKFVHKCTGNVISFSGEFKLFVVQKYEEEGLGAPRIFEEAGFPVTLVGKYLPKDRMRDWRRVFRIHGAKGLLTETRGRATGSRRGRPKTHGATDAETIERLEATVAYLQAENSFLAKLRAKRRE